VRVLSFIQLQLYTNYANIINSIPWLLLELSALCHCAAEEAKFLRFVSNALEDIHIYSKYNRALGYEINPYMPNEGQQKRLPFVALQSFTVLFHLLRHGCLSLVIVSTTTHTGREGAHTACQHAPVACTMYLAPNQVCSQRANSSKAKTRAFNRSHYEGGSLGHH
jgi:hypothetical protein